MDRKRQRERAVTRHPLAWSSSNSARFRCKRGRDVTRHPGLAPRQVIAIAAVTPPLRTRQALLIQPALLAQAPELAALELLDVALAISVRAVLAEHPTLREFGDPALEPVTLLRARRLLARVEPLQRALHHYRVAVLAIARAVAKTDDDDLPF